MSLLPGARVGPYEIVAPLGAGGMGEVYRARDARLNRDVAIKTLPPLFANDPERLARFEREAKTLAALSHPNIAQIYGVEQIGEATGNNQPGRVSALVMELVAGEPLDARIARGPVPLDEALAITRQIADALEAAHDKGIVHRDLKPANVMVTADGDVKVLDFGLARAADPPAQSDPMLSPTITSPATQVGVILGTAAYMSPEQAKGRVADRRSDVWALGCVLFEMLSGRRAFQGEDLSDTLAAVLRAEPDWTLLPASTPPHVTSTIQRCLTKDRKARIPDASVVRFLIDDTAASRHGTFTPTGIAAAPPSRTRRIIPLAIAALAGASLAAAIAWPLLRKEDAPRPSARFRIETPGISRVDQDKAIAISPDGRYIVYEAVTGAGTVLMMRFLDGVEQTALPGTETGQAPFFSPDSKWLGFVTNTGEFRKMPAAGGAVSSIGRMSGSVPRGVTWGEDGTIVFGSAVSSDGLMRMPASGGRPESLTRPDVMNGDSSHRYPRFLPGGKALIYTAVRPGDGTGSASHRLIALDLKTNRSTPLVNGSHAAYIDTGHLIYGYDGTLRAVPFDAERLEVTGEPFTVFERLSVSIAGAANYDVSSRGTLIYMPGVRGELTAKRSLVWVDRNGREEPIAAPTRAYLALRLSADGARAVLDSRDEASDLWIWDFARAILSRLTFEAAPDLFPIWTPDGRWVVYRSVAAGPHNLFRRRSDGTGSAEQLTRATQIHTATDATAGAVIFTDQVETHDIMMVPLEATGGERRVIPLVRTPANERNGTVSPNGRWLAYESDQSGGPQVYVRPFPDTSAGQWQISPGPGVKPRWSRDGRELFYVADDSALMSVAVPDGAVFQPGAPRSILKVTPTPGLVNGLFYDVMPDGRRFVMLKTLPQAAAQAATPHIIAVFDWTDGLRRRPN